ncbi:acid phosphatase [Gluconacetobacter johannae DSM 13595]|nr:metallophosphoesterase [Gluconacetobacter johannae]GBQ91223.1 acid phosphatase [Gluconacetobacter johannae DSM 13595]
MTMILPRRDFLAGATASALLASVPAQARTPTHNCVMIGDWGRQGHYEQGRLAACMGRVAAQHRSLYTVSVGDNFYDDGVQSVTDRQWITSFESIYSAESLKTPWRVILGNHDYRGKVEPQLLYGRQVDSRWYLPARYYSMRDILPDGSTAETFFLDTSPFISRYRGTKVDITGQDTAAQVAWLDAALGASDARWKIVIGHHPVYTAERRFDEPELIAALVPVMKRHGVHVYINGHIHNLQYIERDGIHYINNGAGSRIDPVAPAQDGGIVFPGEHGFMTVALSRDVFQFRFIGIDGRCLLSKSVNNLS